jgi:glycerol uptake facilitator protein
MDPRLFGEFMGTLVLVLIGNGVVANVVLKKTLGSAAGWLTIVFGFGLGVVAGVFVAIACGSDAAHINPAVTLAMVVAGKMDPGVFFQFLVAQTLGGLVGAILVWIHFMPHWAETPDPGSKLACFSTGPAIKNTAANIVSEIIGTFLLVLIIASIVKTGPAPGLVPFLVGAAVWGIGSGLGGTTGFAINPARDLGPRIAHAILPIPGKGGSDFAYGLIVPVLGGLIGGALAGIFIKVAHL